MAKICICGEPVGECIDCYPDNFDENGVRIIEKVAVDSKLEKLETSTEYNNKIFNYISELGKLFSKTVDSSKWSQEVKTNMKNNFLKIEKNIKNEFKPDMGKKKCNKSDCDCHDCGEKKGKRWTAKKFLLTINKTTAPKDMVLNYYNKVMNLKEIAVAKETYKNPKENTIENHLHIYMEFTAKKNIKSPKYFELPTEFSQYGNTYVRIDTIGKKTKEQVFGYLLKEDKDAISYGFNIRKDVYGKLKAKDIWYKYMVGEWNLKDIVTYDPSYMTKNLRKITSTITDNIGFLNSLYGEGNVCFN